MQQTQSQSQQPEPASPLQPQNSKNWAFASVLDAGEGGVTAGNNAMAIEMWKIAHDQTAKTVRTRHPCRLSATQGSASASGPKGPFGEHLPLIHRRRCLPYNNNNNSSAGGKGNGVGRPPLGNPSTTGGAGAGGGGGGGGAELGAVYVSDNENMWSSTTSSPRQQNRAIQQLVFGAMTQSEMSQRSTGELSPVMSSSAQQQPRRVVNHNFSSVAGIESPSNHNHATRQQQPPPRSNSLATSAASATALPMREEPSTSMNSRRRSSDIEGILMCGSLSSAGYGGAASTSVSAAGAGGGVDAVQAAMGESHHTTVLVGNVDGAMMVTLTSMGSDRQTQQQQVVQISENGAAVATPSQARLVPMVAVGLLPTSLRSHRRR